MNFRDFTPQSTFIGLLAGFVGFTSSFAVVLQGLRAVGASEAQAASGLMAAAIAMGLCGIVLSLRTKMPVSVAWSTPGAALLATTPGISGGFSTAIGAFLICGLLIVLAGLWRSFDKLVSAIPPALANAMLAGILLTLCLAPFRAIVFDPLLGLPILIAWIIAGRINQFAAIPAALLAFCLVIFLGVEFPADWQSILQASIIPKPVLVMPQFSWEAMFSIALPLFIVTMASQNIPGIAVLKANDYDPKVPPLLTGTGLFSLFGAPFGSHAVNLAAITAAMMTGDEAGPDRQKRYTAAIVCGFAYVLFGLFAGITTAFVTLAPAVLIEAVAGLALIAAFSGSIVAAFQDAKTRPAAAVTFLASASGISLFGVSGAFWGLIAGGLMLAADRIGKQS